jgi:hypothetical protein
VSLSLSSHVSLYITNSLDLALSLSLPLRSSLIFQIYGVKFDSEQSRWWVIASFSGMMIDMCIQEPIVTAFSVVKFDEGVQALWLSSGLDAIIECVFESIGWM